VYGCNEEKRKKKKKKMKKSEHQPKLHTDGQKKISVVLYRPSDRRLSAKLVPTFADRGCRVVSAADSFGRNLVWFP
jgi:hypothetical protein